MAKTSIASAYVQVIPSAEGVGGKLKNIFGNEMPSVGSDSANTFGAAFASKLKTVIAGVGIGMAVKKIVTESLPAGAELQQSLGGVETMFKDSADTVIANAQRAYQTAGLSANDYMETVTSFSASLLQGLGSDTVAAADIADMAITDMSDNANKFGTDMESIQNAYQGFAKQNYTMLDNLKLGYGGTKSEMERLLADAQELSGVEYNIDNLDDVYEAIHVIQTEIGITGTTAAESATTFSGSLASMKAAATNVLGNLALGEDITPSLVALADTTSNFLLNNLVPMVTNIITALPGAISTFLSAIIPDNVLELVTGAVDNFSAFLSAELPTILDSGTQLITELGTGFFNGIPGFITTVGDLLGQVLGALMDALPQMCVSGVDMVLNLVNGFVEAAPDILTAAAGMMIDLLAELASHLPEMLQQGITLLGELAAGLIQAIPDLVAKLPQVITAIVNKISSYDWIGLGKDIINGLINGIINMLGSVTAASTNVYNSVVSALNALPDTLKNLAGDAVDYMKNKFANSQLANTAQTMIDNAKSKIKDGITAMKNLFNFSWSLPKLKLPHISVSGKFGIDPPSAPKFSISWYRKAMTNAMLLDSPTIFGLSGNTLLGGGEAGREVVAGADTLMGMIETSVSGGLYDLMDQVNDNFTQLFAIMGQYYPQFATAGVYLYEDILVGELAPGMDRALGKLSKQRGRGQ